MKISPAWVGKGLVLLVLLAGVGLRGDGPDPGRFRRIGNQLMCSCGCTQGALVCNHVGCPVVENLRSEIAQRVQSPDSDALILQAFVQEYGPAVLAVPPDKGFGRLAWVTPWAVGLLGLGMLVVIIQVWSKSRAQQQALALAHQVCPETLAKVHADMERELKNP
ncbi:MAG: cytochrome c-type biogenesis protein [Terriglobales bacterium]